MSTETKTNTSSKDMYTVYQQGADKFLDTVKQSVPRYHQSVTNAQQEYVEACENALNSTITMQKEFARKAGIETSMPDAALKAVRTITDDAVKAVSAQNQMALATIDAAGQNIRTFNDNAKAFADLNRNMLRSWMSSFTSKN